MLIDTLIGNIQYEGSTFFGSYDHPTAAILAFEAAHRDEDNEIYTDWTIAVSYLNAPAGETHQVYADIFSDAYDNDGNDYVEFLKNKLK